MVIEFNLIVLIAFLAMYFFFRGLCIFIQSKELKLTNEITNFGFFISIVLIISATLFPIRLNVPFEGFEIYNIIPFKVPLMIYRNYSFAYFLYQTVGNILMFVPFGFFVYSKTGFNMKRSIQACFMLTLFVEITQGFIPYRCCEIDDLWLNTLGGSIGAFSYYLCIRLKTTYSLLMQKSS